MSDATKAFRKQARQAERAALRSTDDAVANQMRNLAEAFRAQADVMKKKRKKNQAEK